MPNNDNTSNLPPVAGDMVHQMTGRIFSLEKDLAAAKADLCRHHELIVQLSGVVTTDHESKEEFAQRIRNILARFDARGGNALAFSHLEAIAKDIRPIIEENERLRRESALDAVEIGRLNALVDQLKDRTQVIHSVLQYEVDILIRRVGVGRVEAIGPGCESVAVYITEDVTFEMALLRAVELATAKVREKRQKIGRPAIDKSLPY
jgi:hypothetical protein